MCIIQHVDLPIDAGAVEEDMAVSLASAAWINVAISQAATALGYSQFRRKQVEALQHFLSGRDVFVSIPTGM